MLKSLLQGPAKIFAFPVQPLGGATLQIEKSLL